MCLLVKKYWTPDHSYALIHVKTQGCSSNWTFASGKGECIRDLLFYGGGALLFGEGVIPIVDVFVWPF